MLSRVSEKKECPKIQAGAKPRETLEGRLREQFNLPLDSTFESERGENIDMQVFEGKAYVPNTRSFSHIKFFNPKTGRTSNIYSCDQEYCGMYFRKWNNLFDHLRTHTLEKPYICPVEGCGMTFSQASNQKKHLDIHRKDRNLICFECKQRVTKNKILSHFQQMHSKFGGSDLNDEDNISI